VLFCQFPGRTGEKRSLTEQGAPSQVPQQISNANQVTTQAATKQCFLQIRSRCTCLQLIDTQKCSQGLLAVYLHGCKPPSQSLPIHLCTPIRATAQAHITGTLTKENAMKHTFPHPQHAGHHLPFPPRLCTTVYLFPGKVVRAIPQQHTNLLAPLINPQHTHSQC